MDKKVNSSFEASEARMQARLVPGGDGNKQFFVDCEKLAEKVRILKRSQFQAKMIAPRGMKKVLLGVAAFVGRRLINLSDLLCFFPKLLGKLGQRLSGAVPYGTWKIEFVDPGEVATTDESVAFAGGSDTRACLSAIQAAAPENLIVVEGETKQAAIVRTIDSFLQNHSSVDDEIICGEPSKVPDEVIAVDPKAQKARVTDVADPCLFEIKLNTYKNLSDKKELSPEEAVMYQQLVKEGFPDKVKQG